MVSFAAADKEITENSDRVNDITRLVQLIIDSNKCEFKTGDLDFDIALLIKEDVLKVRNDIIELQEHYLLHYIALREFCKKFGYSMDNDLDGLFNFLDKINKYFYPKPHQGKSRFTAGLNATALLWQHQLFRPSLNNFVSTWKKEPGDAFFAFSRALSTIFEYLEYDAETILSLVTSLYTLHEFDKPDVYNLNIVELNKGIMLLGNRQPEKAKQLLHLLKKNVTTLNETILIPVLAGLREQDAGFVAELESLSKSEQYQVAIICSLSAGEPIPEIYINRIILLTKGIENNSKRYRQQLPRYYVQLINNPHTKDQSVIIYCWDELTNLITDQDADIALSVIQMLSIIKGSEKEKAKLLIACIKQDHFNENLIPTMSHVFFDFKDSNHFFDFLMIYAEKFRFKSDERIFSSTAFYIREKDPVAFDNKLIEMLINNNAGIRWVGERLFSDLSFSQGLTHFSYNILALPAREQFKLFTSILSDFHEPKYTVPFLLPLIDSTDEVVKEALICRLELLTEDYGSGVTEVIKNEWKEMTHDQDEIFKRVERYMTHFSDQLATKNKIKELNPWYTQSDNFNNYITLHRTLFARKLEESVDQNSIFRHIATTVVLAKGGGWKHETKDEVSQLSTFSSSMTLPRSYFISPDNFDWDRKMEMLEDWSNFFEGWEATI